jgi:LDH2 family malate/lactate/ureidoglycolate dehydrogenase
MDRFVGEIKSQPLAEGFNEIFYPGEMEHRAEVKHLMDGLVLPADTWLDLERIANAIGASDLLAHCPP